MGNNLKVAWINGMNVDRVHFEQLERYFDRNINFKTIYIQNNQYGIIVCDISRELLRQGKIGVERVSGIVQDGSVFDAPADDLLPQPLEVNTSNVENPIIVLKFPLCVDTVIDLSVQNILPDTKYLASSILVRSKTYDEIHHGALTDSIKDDMQHSMYSQEQIKVTVASLRFSLGFLGSKNPNEIEIPICKIKNIDTGGNIILDEKFIPTTLNIATQPIIVNFFEDILYSTRQYFESFVSELSSSSLGSSVDFSTFVAIQATKKWNAIFDFLRQKKYLHPELFYEKLIEFYSELKGLDFSSKKMEFPPYNHLNISSSILPIIDEVKFLVSKAIAPQYISAKVRSLGNGFHICFFDSPSVIANATIYFAVASKNGAAYLQQHFKTQSKISSEASIRHKLSSQLSGLGIEMITIIPSVLPRLNNYVYFKIDRQDSNYDEILNEGKIAFYMTHQIIDPDLKVWAVNEQ